MKQLFLSTPISTIGTQQEYDELLSWVKDVRDTLRERFSMNVYCAALSVSNLSTLNDPRDSALSDLEALNESPYFALWYPRNLATSALIELGYALGAGKEILILCRDNQQLPFLARKLDKTNKRVRISAIQNAANQGTEVIVHWLLGRLSR